MRHLAPTHLHDRRRSVLAWGIPLGLWSAFIVSIFPSIEGTLSKLAKGYPPALKEAFGVSELANVEQYLQAEMLSLIVPLALGYLAVRAVASGLSGAAESGRLDVLLSAPVSRRSVAAASFAATAVELATVLALAVVLTVLGSLALGRRPGVRLGRRRLRQRLASGAAFRRPRRRRHRLVAAHQRRHGIGRGGAGLDVRDRPDRKARLRPLRRALHLGLQVLRQRDRRRHRTTRLLRGHRRRVVLAALGAWLFERRDLSGVAPLDRTTSDAWRRVARA